MGVLQRFEKRLENLVEGAFARVFKGVVHPVEIASAMQREADEHKTVLGGGRILVANRYVIDLSPGDHDRLAQYAAPLAQELAQAQAEFIGEQGWMVYGDVIVEIERGDGLETGMFRVAAEVYTGGMESQPPPPPPPANQSYGGPSGYGQPPAGGPSDQYGHSSAPPAPAYPTSGAPSDAYAQQMNQPYGGPPSNDPYGQQQPADPYGQQQPGPYGGGQNDPYSSPQSGPPAANPYEQPYDQQGRPGDPYSAPASGAPAAPGYPAPASGAGYGAPSAPPAGPGVGLGQPIVGGETAQHSAPPFTNTPGPPTQGAPGPSSGYQARLISAEGRQFTLNAGSTVIGRGEGSQIRLADVGISRQHARLDFDGARVVLTDLGSTNGTTVNGNRINAVTLQHGDVIQLGTTTMTFRMDG